MSCVQRDLDLSEGKIGDESGMGSGCARDASRSVVDEGNMASRWACVAARRSGNDESASKSMRGWASGA